MFLFILPTTWESNAAILSSALNNSGKVQRYASALHLLKAPLRVDVFGVFFFMYMNTRAHDGIEIYKFHHHHYKQYLQLAATHQHCTVHGKQIVKGWAKLGR